MASQFRVVVVGASAGGIPPLQAFAAGLPPDLPAAVFVVVHMRDDAASLLAEILDRSGPLPAAPAMNGEKIRPGRIYAARPGHHLLIDGDHVGVKIGPKENRFRPSIDALFRSAAYMSREHVIGVLLSGLLSDGTSGLWTIKQFGGVTIVQDPKDALYDSMPVSAIEQVEIDHILPTGEIGPVVARLSETGPAAVAELPRGIIERIRREVEVAGSDDAFTRGMMDFGELTQFTCPECHGVLVKIREGTLVRYRCHTGHGFTGNTLLSGITESMEASLWGALRAMEEGVMLLEHMARHFTETGRPEDAEIFEQKAKEMRKKARVLQEQAARSEHLSEDKLASGNKPLLRRRERG